MHARRVWNAGLVLFSVALVSQNSAAVLCVKKRGVVVLRDGAACRARETALDVVALGLT